jgi:hypothetical protein
MAVPYLLSFGWGQRYKIKNTSHKKWYYFYDTSDDLVRLLKRLVAGSLDTGHLYRGSWFSFEEGLRRFRQGLEVG